MGQKSNPGLLRLKVNKSQDSIWFSDFSYTKNVSKELLIRTNLSKLLSRKRRFKKRKPLRKKKLLRKPKKSKKKRNFSLSKTFIQILPQRIWSFPFIAEIPKQRKRRRINRRGLRRNQFKRKSITNKTQRFKSLKHPKKIAQKLSKPLKKKTCKSPNKGDFNFKS